MSNILKLTKEAAAYKCSIEDARDVMQIIDLHATGAQLSDEAVAALVKFSKWQIIKTAGLSAMLNDGVDAEVPSLPDSKFVKKGEKGEKGEQGSCQGHSLTPVGSPFSFGDLDMQIFSVDGSKPSSDVVDSVKASIKAKLMQMFGTKPPKTNPLFEPSENAAADFKPRSKLEVFFDESGKKKFRVRYRMISGDGLTEHSVTYQTGEEAHSKSMELLKDSSVVPWDE